MATEEPQAFCFLGLLKEAGSTQTLMMEGPIYKIPPIKVDVVIPDDSITDIEKRCVVLGHNLGILMTRDNTVNCMYVYSGALLGILGHILGEVGLKRGKELDDAAYKAHALFNMVVVSEDDIPDYMETREFKKFLAQIDEANFPTFKNSLENQLLPIGVISLFIGNFTTAAFYEDWAYRRIQACRYNLELTDTACFWKVSMMPPQVAMYVVNIWLSAKFELRKHVFILLVELSITPRYGKFFQLVVEQLRGTKLGQFLKVKTLIWSKYPKLLNMHILERDVETFKISLATFMSFPEEERLFVKLTRNANETYPLLAKHYPLLAQAADAVEQFESPWLKRLPKRTSGYMISDIVHKYLASVKQEMPMTITLSNDGDQ